MKIIQFMASQHWGGAEKVFVDLSNELSERHDVIALLLRGTQYGGRFSEKVRRLELCSHPTRHNPFLLYEIYKVLKELKPDVVHTHAVKGSELVRSANRFIGLHHLATKHNSRKGKVFESLKWVSVISADARDSVKMKSGGNVEIIRNGLYPCQFSKLKKDDRFRVAAVGRLDKIKGFDLLIRQLSELHIPCSLTIVGEGPEKNNLERLVSELRQNHRISLPGFSDNVPGLMEQADLIVISSHSEGFPNVLVESLFYANMLISTPVGGVKEILPENLLCSQNELGRKIEDVFGEYDVYRKQFTEVKEKHASLLTMDRIVFQYEELYDRMLGESNMSD